MYVLIYLPNYSRPTSTSHSMGCGVIQILQHGPMPGNMVGVKIKLTISARLTPLGTCSTGLVKHFGTESHRRTTATPTLHRMLTCFQCAERAWWVISTASTSPSLTALLLSLHRSTSELNAFNASSTLPPSYSLTATDTHAKNQGQRSNGSNRRVPTANGHTCTHTDTTKRIISPAMRSIKMQCTVVLICRSMPAVQLITLWSWTFDLWINACQERGRGLWEHQSPASVGVLTW